MTSAGTTDLTATPNTVLTHDLENTAVPEAKKQKQEAPAVADEAKPKKSFKAVANLVLAMKRFQAAINPTYEYGKQPNQQPLARAVRQSSPAAGGVPAADKETRNAHTHDHLSFYDRGHKADILLNKLPDTPETASDQE